MNRRGHSTFFFLGRPLSPLYSAAMKLRALLYQKNILIRQRLEVPVISVGNLSMGGTGKTPMVIYLGRFLADMGFRPAVVSRGYHGKAKGPVNIVSDGDSLLMQSYEAGDEPVLISSRLPGTVVATGKKRYQVGAEVIRAYDCNLMIMDDGFQHLGVARDIDLVLFDADHFAGNSRVFPGGELREPVSALHRCDAFIITGVTEYNCERAGKCEDLLKERFGGKPIFKVSPTYSQFFRYDISPSSINKSVVSPSDIPKCLFSFSGIAQADRFYKMVEQQGITLAGRKSFRDHHLYGADDVMNLIHLATQAGAEGFLTTEKDIVKFSETHHCRFPIYVPLLDYARNASLESFIINNLNEISSNL